MTILLPIILTSILGFLVVWLVLAISLNLRDMRKRKPLQRRRQQEMAKQTVQVEQVMRMAQWMMEREKLN